MDVSEHKAFQATVWSVSLVCRGVAGRSYLHTIEACYNAPLATSYWDKLEEWRSGRERCWRILYSLWRACSRHKPG